MTAFLIAFVPRAALGALILFFELEMFFAPDSYAYASNGSDLASFWHGRGVEPDSWVMDGGQGHYVMANAAVYYLLGRAPLVLVLLNAAAGAWTAILSARLATRLAGAAAGRRVFWLVALFPSLVLWSSLNLRDSFLILAVVGATWSAVELREKGQLHAGIPLLLWLLVLAALREYAFVVVASSVIVGLLLGRQEHPFRSYAAAAAIIVIAALVTSQLASSGALPDNASLERLGEIRGGFAAGAASGYQTNVEPGSLRGEIASLPLGLAYFLLGPFPWAVTGTLSILTIPEVLLWYWLLSKTWPGVRSLRREHPGALWVLVGVVVGVSVFYALISGNVGTAYRHRAQILPLFLTIAGIGWAANDRRSSSWSTERATAAMGPVSDAAVVCDGPSGDVRGAGGR